MRVLVCTFFVILPCQVSKHLWPSHGAHWFMPLVFVGNTLMLLVMKDTRVVLLTSAVGCMMLLTLGLGILVTGVSEFVLVLSTRPPDWGKLPEFLESHRYADIHMQSEFATRAPTVSPVAGLAGWQQCLCARQLCTPCRLAYP